MKTEAKNVDERNLTTGATAKRGPTRWPPTWEVQPGAGETRGPSGDDAKGPRVKMLASHGMAKSDIRLILALPFDDWGQACLDAFTAGREIFRRRVKQVAAIYFTRNDPAEAERVVAHAKNVIADDAMPDIPESMA